MYMISVNAMGEKACLSINFANDEGEEEQVRGGGYEILKITTEIFKALGGSCRSRSSSI